MNNIRSNKSANYREDSQGKVISPNRKSQFIIPNAA